MKEKRAIGYAILAAALYALSSPISKLLLKEEVPETILASFLYLGAGLGISVVYCFRRRITKKGNEEVSLEWKDWPYVIGMVALDILAPVLLMSGLNRTTAENVSLLNNFEIVATAVIASFLFREKISKKLWCAIGLVTVASALLSFEDMSSFSFSTGSLLVLGATLCWGLENNCTRKISEKDPLQIVIVKGWGSGLGALAIAFLVGERLCKVSFLLVILLLGFVAYGLSIVFYVRAQRDLGAARTSAYYAIAPFIGVGLSLLMFWELPKITFWIALVLMLVGTRIASKVEEEITS